MDLPSIVAAVVTGLGTGGLVGIWLKFHFDKKQLAITQQNDANMVLIKHDLEKNVIEFKHKLELAATERNLRYSKTFEQTADTIVKVYGHLINVYVAAGEYSLIMNIGDAEAKHENSKKLSNALDEFSKHFVPNKIYIPLTTARNISDFIGVQAEVIRKQGLLYNFSKGNLVNEQQLKKFSDDIDELQKKIPDLLTGLEIEFQTILGFPIPDKKSE